MTMECKGWMIFFFFVFFYKIFGGHMSFSWGHWYPCFRLLMTSALGFKARVDLSCTLSCLRATPQIQLRCNTCQPLDSRDSGLSCSLHAAAEVGCRGSNGISCSEHRRSTHSAIAPGWVELFYTSRALLTWPCCRCFGDMRTSGGPIVSFFYSLFPVVIAAIITVCYVGVWVTIQVTICRPLSSSLQRVLCTSVFCFVSILFCNTIL